MDKRHLLLITLAAVLAGCSSPVEQAKSPGDLQKPTAALASPTSMPVGGSDINSEIPPASCPLSVPANPEFIPPSIPFVSPQSSLPDAFWIGTDHLWTSLPQSSVWAGLPDNPDGYTQKIFWWSDLFSLKDEPEPDLVVTGQRLDAEAPPLKVSRATNAFSGDIGEAMLVGVDFPTTGCWEIRGNYKKTNLTFVVWVAP